MIEERPVEIVNLTGHKLLIGSRTKQNEYASEGRIRLDTRYEEVMKLILQRTDSGRPLRIPLLELINSGDLSALPEAKEGVLYVVSGLVAQSLRRPDVVSPARLHKENGRTMYARALLRYI